MEPLELALIAVAATLVNKAVETTGEKVTESALETILPFLKSAIVTLPAQLQERITWLGKRVQARLPADSASSTNSMLVVEVVDVEAQDPEVAAVIEDIAQALPRMEIKIDQRKQQGVVIDGQSTAHFNEKIEQSFS